MSTITAKPAIGFIGLGDQGLPMAMAIAQAGYPLHVSSDERDDKLLPTFCRLNQFFSRLTKFFSRYQGTVKVERAHFDTILFQAAE
jgi:hypothetical protein